MDVAKLKRGGTISCGDCERSVAVKFCFDCRCGYCEPCTAHHNKCARFDGHRLDEVAKVLKWPSFLILGMVVEQKRGDSEKFGILGAEGL